MDLSADLVIRAARVSVDIADGRRHVGFAEGGEDEPYALFSQSQRGGAVRLELNDPIFVADGAVAGAEAADDALLIEIEPGLAADLGFAHRVLLRQAPAGPGHDDWTAALAALQRMLGDRFVLSEAPAGS